MGFIKGVVISITFFLVGLYGDTLSTEEKLEKTQKYLCQKVSSTLCDINQAYMDFHAYHTKIMKEINLGVLGSSLEDSLESTTMADIDTIRDLSDKYDLGAMLLIGIKYSKYYHLSEKFEDNTLVPLNEVMESNNDSTWDKEGKYYESEISFFDKNYEDPYTDAIHSWTEIVNNAIDSYNQMKASADLAWSVSELTFLKSLKILKEYENASKTMDNSKALYTLVTDTYPMMYQYIVKSQKDGLTMLDIGDILDKLTALSKDLKDEETKGANVLKAILLIDKFIKSYQHEQAANRLYEKYKDDIFTKHIVEGIKKSSTSETMINYGELADFIVGLVPDKSETLSGISKSINNFIKAFMDYNLKIRRVLHKDSLNSEYLSLLANRMNISQTLYTRFMYGYFNTHMQDIINLKAYDYAPVPDTKVEEQKLKIFWSFPATTSINDGYIKVEVGDEIELKFTELGGELTDFVKDGVEKGEKFYIWYDSKDGRDKVELTLKSQSDGIYTFSFKAPKNEFNIVNFSFYSDELNGYESFGYGEFVENLVKKEPVSKEELVTQDLTQDEKDSYQECIDNGGTEIGCRVGMYVVNKIDLNRAKDITLKDNFAYIADGSAGVKIIDISNPLNLKITTSLDVGGDVNSVEVEGDYAYITLGNNGVKIINISDPSKVKVVGSIDTNGTANDIKIDGNYAYIADRNEGLKVLDISDPSNPKLLSVLDLDQDALVIRIKGNYAYITGYDSGLNIIDISNPENPKIKGWVYCCYNAVDIDVKGNYAYISDNDGAVKIIDVSDPSDPKLKGSISADGNSLDTEIVNNYLYITSSKGLMIADISDPVNPKMMSIIGISARNVKVNGKYAYVIDYGEGLKIIDISKIIDSNLKAHVKTDGVAVAVKIVGNYAYIADGKAGLKIIDISDPINPTIISSLDTDGSVSHIEVVGNYAYIADGKAGLKIIDISDPLNPTIKSSLDTNNALDLKIVGNYVYVADNSAGVKIIDISDPSNPTIKSNVDTNGSAYSLDIKGNYAYVANIFKGIKVIDISDPINPTIKNSLLDSGYDVALNIYADEDNLYVATGWTGTKIVNITDPLVAEVQDNIRVNFGYTLNIQVKDNYIYEANGLGGVTVIDITDLASPITKGQIYTYGYVYDLEVQGDYIYIADGDMGLRIIDAKKVIENYQLLQAYYHPTTNISLFGETNKDYTVQTQNFTKEWTFDQDISNFDIEVISNTYANSINKNSFTKDEKTLKVTLSPNTFNPLNKLVLMFSKDGNPVKVNGSETFWSLTKTNHAPRLADGQITQLVSSTDKTAVLDIETYDGDGDIVTLSIEDSDGGDVVLNGNKLTASFNDGKTEHTVKIGLSDGKEKVIKEFHVLQFDNSSIKDFYSDVSTNASYPFDGIAFGTLKGVIWGQSDPNDPSKRIFRPTDDASMAEALAMVINAEKKAGLITLDSSNYYMDIYPNWAMPYYTFARENEAIDKMNDLSSYYPTREEIAKIVVKTLHLDDKVSSMDLNSTFSDKSDFSDAQMLRYAEVANFFGLFMTDGTAKPKEHISRAELATVIEKIFMIPSADISFNPAPVEYGESVDANVTDIKAQVIDSSYHLLDNSKNIGIRYIYENYFIKVPIDTSILLSSTNNIKALISNKGVKDIVDIPIHITFTDTDNDGVQDKYDTWPEDTRYQIDKNNNGIPDILDTIYNLSEYSINDTVSINGHKVSIKDIVTNGFIPENVYVDNPNDDILVIKKGWNLISFGKYAPCRIEKMMSGQDAKMLSWSYDEGVWKAQTNSDDIYDRLTEKNIEIFDEVKAYQGVWLMSSKDINISLDDIYTDSGDEISLDINSSALKNGWHILGNIEENATTVFSRLPNAKIIWQYKDTNWSYLTKENIDDIPYDKIEKIDRYDGFWSYIQNH